MQRIFPAVTLTATGAVLLAGCGPNPFDASDLDDAAPQTSGVPVFGDIRQDAFDAMLGAESVTITGEVEAGEADLDELFDGIDSEETGQLEISGALDGSDSEMSFSAGGSSFAQRAVDGEEYFAGEDFAALLISELDDELAEEVSEEFIEDLVADQWVQFTDGGDGSVFSAEEFLTTWQQELAEEDYAELTAETETRDGEEVWVYGAEEMDIEIVLAADEQAPYLVEITDEDSHYSFTEWNDSAPPEEPEDVITLDEIFEAIAAEQGWPTEDVEGGQEDANGAEA